MTLLGAAATQFNPGATVLFVYAAASAGISESRRDALRWFVGLTVIVSVLSLLPNVPLPWRLWSFIPPLLFIWIVGAIQMEEAERSRDAAELRLRNARIEHLATVSERERIARDLHDLLGHSLTAVVMRAQLTKELVSRDPARAREEAAEIERTARDALAEIRKAVNGWRQASLDAELESARKALASAGVDLIVRRDANLVIVGSTEHELALALREAITNVIRHAKARTCHVGIDADAGELRLVIADDGVGSNKREGNGLAGVRERITALGGHVQRNGATGMTVSIAVPIQVAT
jgi:two-component system sensor histidine kinase DesK